MRADALHSEFELFYSKWLRARDVIAGEDNIKAAGERYLPRLESQTDEEYAVYVARAAFFNGTARTLEGFAGMIFRREPVVRTPSEGGAKPSSKYEVRSANGSEEGRRQKESEKEERSAGDRRTLPSNQLAEVFKSFEADVDLLGTPLYSFAKRLTAEVLAVGRAGTLIEWNDEEQRAFLALYQAEQIINWRMERIQGRQELALVVLREVGQDSQDREDYFESQVVEQIRVLRLVRSTGHFTTEGTESAEGGRSEGSAKSEVRSANTFQYVVEIWRKEDAGERATDASKQREWVLVERRVPRRRGRPLSAIPFVFHGPYDSQPSCAKPPLDDVIAVNLDHYRLDADYKHGLHFTALPTAWVSGFHKDAQLRIGSSTAWVTDTIGAHAGFLEFTGQGLTTFERAMDRAEKLMAILGSRLLETQKRVSESAEALSLRQAGEGSIVANISGSISKGVTQILRWVYFWHSIPRTDEGGGLKAESIGEKVVSFTLNQDFETATMTPQELVALVQAWQAGAVSTETLHNLMRRGEVLEPSRSNEEEAGAIREERGKSFTLNQDLSTSP